MSQGNVSRMAHLLNKQENVIRTGPPPLLKKPKPSVASKENNTDHHNGVNSTAKKFTPPQGPQASVIGISGGANLTDIKSRLKKPPPPKPPVRSEVNNDSPIPRRPSLIKPKPGTKPKPPVYPRKPSVTSSDGPISPTTPKFAAKDKVPKSDDSVSQTSIESSSFSDSSLPRTESSTSQCTSRTESNASRRTSGKPELQILPPVDVLGEPPPKPSFKPRSLVLPSPTPVPKLVKKRSSILHQRILNNSPRPSTSGSTTGSIPTDQESEETDEFYDDVAAGATTIKKDRPVSLIRPIESDEEFEDAVDPIPTIDSDEECDDVYDDTGTTPEPIENLPLTKAGGSFKQRPKQPPPPLPDVNRLPPLPSTDSIPHLPPSPRQPHHSPHPSTTEDSGNNDFGDVYDDVSLPDEGEQDDLYEALDEETRNEIAARMPDGASQLEETQEISAKELEAQKKREEKLKREQERLQKKEEERRKKEEEKKEKERLKKEREDKKRREKEEKDAKKKFNIKGEIQVLETGTVVEDCQPEYADKLDLSVSKGETLEILRQDKPNPPGRWLVRNAHGYYGYVSSNCIAVDGDDQEVYDDVAAIETDDAGLTIEGDSQEVYDDVAAVQLAGGQTEDIYDSVDDH